MKPSLKGISGSKLKKGQTMKLRLPRSYEKNYEKKYGVRPKLKFAIRRKQIRGLLKQPRSSLRRRSIGRKYENGQQKERTGMSRIRTKSI